MTPTEQFFCVARVPKSVVTLDWLRKLPVQALVNKLKNPNVESFSSAKLAAVVSLVSQCRLTYIIPSLVRVVVRRCRFRFSTHGAEPSYGENSIFFVFKRALFGLGCMHKIVKMPIAVLKLPSWLSAMQYFSVARICLQSCLRALVSSVVCLLLTHCKLSPSCVPSKAICQQFISNHDFRILFRNRLFTGPFFSRMLSP